MVGPGRSTLLLALLAAALPASAEAQVAVQRTRYELPSSNGHGAIVVHLDDSDPSRARRVTHFREHLFAAEEPVVDANGDEVWGGNDFEAVYTRDLVYDAYFGLRGAGGNLWLPTAPADLDASGYAEGGTGVVTLVQSVGELEVTSYFFAPFDLEETAFVMAIQVHNGGNTTASDVQGFSLHNVHLGSGRPDSPWDLPNDIGENGETLARIVDADGEAFVEQGFAGVVASRAVGSVNHFGTAPDADVFTVVDDGGFDDLPDNAPPATAVDGAVGAWQFDLGDIPAGGDAWAAIVVAHHGDPFAGTATLAIVDAYVDDRDAQELVDDEIAGWADFQSGLTIPSDADSLEERLIRQSAAMLRMGQVRETETYLREWLSQDGEIRRTRFPSKANPASLPATVEHLGYGAVLASLPPGNWTYAWIRDGAYAIKAMAALGMQPEARDALAFYLGAEAGRFQDWTELEDYAMPPYQITLTRYYGFGVEETDFNAFGPNLEFDGFGLFLWALREYERQTGDQSLTDDNWSLISTEMADVLVDLVEPTSGLILPDSSIWETHWNGRERQWGYTNITAVRGLCDAAEMAERNGDDSRAQTYRDTAESLREAIATQLTDNAGAIASNAEELASGSGHFDAAVLDAISMGLFSPEGDIAQATFAALDEHLLTDASEVGWSRNDDRFDHGGGEDLSPWGSDYDSAEWVITDLRGAIASRELGDDARSDAILQWVLAQSLENYLMVAETYEETTGEYKFNTPMLGFGAGAYSLAIAHRDGLAVMPACGHYYEDDDEGTTGGSSTSGDNSSDDGSASQSEGEVGEDADIGEEGDSADGGSSGGETLSGGAGEGESPDGCGCTTTGSGPGWAWVGVLGLLAWRRRVAAVAVVAAASGCSDDGSSADGGTTGSDTGTTIPVTSADETSGPASNTASSSTTGDPDTGSGSSDTTGGNWEEVDVCPASFSFEAEGAVSNVRVAGEWQDFDLPTATSLSESGGVWTATVDLAPGLHAYKLVFNDSGGTQWILDPGRGRRKYVDDVENSAIKVPDCNLPRFEVAASTVLRPSAGAGSYAAELTYIDGAPGSGPDSDSYGFTLRHAGSDDAITPNVDENTGDVTVALEDLDDGKYTLLVTATSRSGHVADVQRLVFWVEAEPFQWDDALIYMVMTDRYRDGIAGNNPPPTPGADPRADWQGGDFDGLRQSIESGLLDQLGVRAIWLSPLQTNPDGGYLAADDFHVVTGYHGYWPISAREVDARLGTEADLHALVDAAHAHGIRILQDYVINHVHEDHEYVEQHPEWFRTGCVCGTNGCDWTADAIICQFRPYMPDIDHTVPEATAQFVDDAIWWLDEFDLDGLRVDAVKHVEEVATRNLSVEVRETFEPAGTKYFMMGETAMGWNDCADPCNDENYETISRYVGPFGLDGQFDFVLYHGVSYRTFAYGDNGMLHADFWFGHGQTKWPEGAIMTPYIGSHDTARFASIADYRGQDAGHDRGIPFNQWDFIAAAPTDEEPYRRMRIAMAWLLGLPGAPLLYYGDEYGQFGGVDPNNRLMWRPESDLNGWESDTLAFIRQVGTARQQISALRRGDYVSLYATDDTLVFGRLEEPGEAAVVGITRADSPVNVTFSAVQLGFDPGTTLTDALGGPSVTVDSDGDVTVDIPGDGAVILAP